MKVFKLYLKLAKNEWKTILMYVLLSFMVFMFMSAFSESVDWYSPTDVEIAVVDQDDSKLSLAIYEYLEDTFTINDKIDTVEKADDALFYKAVRLVMVIPKGFESGFEQGNIKIETRTDKNSSYGKLGEQKINEYLNMLKRMISVYPNQSYQELNQRIQEIEKDNVDVKMISGNKSKSALSYLSTYFNFLSYTLISVLIVSIGLCISSMRSSRVHLRMMSSPMSSSQLTFEMILGAGVTSILFLGLFYVGIYFLNDLIFTSKEGVLLMLNGLLFTSAILTFAIMIAMIVSSKIERSKIQEIITAICNILGLSLSFLSGAFVPQAFIGQGLLKIASFMPSYWFIKTNDLIASQNYSHQEILFNMGILVLFTIAFSLLTILINRIKISQNTVA